MTSPAKMQPDLDFESAASDGLAKWRTTVQPAKKVEPLELNFATGSDQLTPWRVEQAEKILRESRREGLPIGEGVRVILQSDLELTGRLVINREESTLEIDGVPFQKSEIVSCVRVDTTAA